MKLGKAGTDLIKFYETFEAEAYLDPVGIWTIGYGSTRLNGSKVLPGMVINELVAEALLLGTAQQFLNFVEKHVKVSLNQNQIDALGSLVYNIGTTNFFNSTLLRAINSNAIIVEDLFSRWNKGHVDGVLTVLDGLTKRRKKEFELFKRNPNVSTIPV